MSFSSGGGDAAEEPNGDQAHADDDTQDATQHLDMHHFMSSQGSDSGGGLPVDIALENRPWGRLAGHSVIELYPREERNGAVNEYVLGRSSQCDISVSHASVSSRHCRIWCEPAAAHPSGCAAPAGSPLRVFIEDLSTNGTYIRTPTHQNVALRKHQRYELRSGDEISLVGRSGATSPRGPTGEAVDSAAAARGGHGAAGAATSNMTGMVVFMWCDLQGRSVEGMPALPAAQEDAATTRASGMQPPRPRHNSIGGSSSSGPRPNRVEDLYEMGEVLGEGQCGKVYRSTERSNGAHWAIKVLKLKQFALSSTTADLLREADIMKQLAGHPNVISLKDVFQTSDALFFVMELVPSGDLLDWVINHGAFRDLPARCFMRQLLSAVKHLHQKDIVHRDLKPENILLDMSAWNADTDSGEMRVKITDFGLAKRATQDGLKTFCGTPQYFAPEVLQRWGTVAGTGRYGPEVDMWSVGVILHVVLTGRNPFNDESTMWQQIAEAQYTLDDPDWNGVHPAAMNLVRRLLTLSPQQRLSAPSAASHPWVASDAPVDVHSLPAPPPTAAEAAAQAAAEANAAAQRAAAERKDALRAAPSPSASSSSNSGSSQASNGQASSSGTSSSNRRARATAADKQPARAPLQFAPSGQAAHSRHAAKGSSSSSSAAGNAASFVPSAVPFSQQPRRTPLPSTAQLPRPGVRDAKERAVQSPSEKASSNANLPVKPTTKLKADSAGKSTAATATSTAGKHPIAFGSRAPARRDRSTKLPPPRAPPAAAGRPAVTASSSAVAGASSVATGSTTMDTRGAQALVRGSSVCDEIDLWPSSDDEEEEGGLAGQGRSSNGGKRRMVVHVDASGKRRSVDDPEQVAMIRGLSPEPKIVTKKQPAAATVAPSPPSPPRPPPVQQAHVVDHEQPEARSVPNTGDNEEKRRLSALPHFPPLEQPALAHTADKADGCGSNDRSNSNSNHSSNKNHTSSGSCSGAADDGDAKQRSINDVLGKRKHASNDSSFAPMSPVEKATAAAPLSPPVVDEPKGSSANKGASKGAGNAVVGSSRGQRSVASFFMPVPAKTPNQNQ